MELDLDMREAFRSARRGLKPYAEPRWTRPWVEILATFALFLPALGVGLWLLPQTAWALPLVGVLMGPAMLRLFIIQHDCGHGSFFPTQSANRWLGRFLSLITWTPFARWKNDHAAHHATSGHLDKRRVDRDIYTMTVAEFGEASPIFRTFYRLMRHRFVLVFLLPLPVFAGEGRRFWGVEDPKSRRSVILTNLAIAGLIAAAVLAGVLGPYLILQLIGMQVAGSIGIWLFYVQHQYPEAWWRPGGEWSQAGSAFHGSSWYDLPAPLAWLTGWIGFHHVHHANPKVPMYELSRAHNALPTEVVNTVNRLGVWRSLTMPGTDLWDEAKGRLVSFREARQTHTGGAAAAK